MSIRKIKILQTIRQGKFGGGETHVLELSSRLDSSKFEVVVLSFTDGPMIDELNARGIRNIVIPTERAFDLSICRQVFVLLKQEKFDLIHAHGSRACSNVIWAAKALKIPVIYTVHGWSFHPDQKNLIHRLRVISEQVLTTLSNKTICVSRSNQQEGQIRFNLQRSEVIYNAVDFSQFNYIRKYPSLRNELNISADKVVIGYIVRITIQKNPIVLIESWRKVVLKDRNGLLLIVGDGDLKMQMQQLVQDYQLQDNVIFLPFRTDIPVVLSAIDIYCLPSLWEGFPIGILEAMAMKKVVLTTPVNGNTELVKDDETGLLAPVSDIDALAEKMLRLITNPDLRISLSENAYSHVRANFNFEEQVLRIEQLYLSLYSN